MATKADLDLDETLCYIRRQLQKIPRTHPKRLMLFEMLRISAEVYGEVPRTDRLRARRQVAEADDRPEPTTTPEDTLREAGISSGRQARYQRRMSSLLAGRA